MRRQRIVSPTLVSFLGAFFLTANRAYGCCSPQYSYCSYGGAWNLAVLATCTSSATQMWSLNTTIYSQIVSGAQQCFDLCGYSLYTGSQVGRVVCNGDNAQNWYPYGYPPSGFYVGSSIAAAQLWCLQAVGSAGLGTILTVAPCDALYPLAQQFYYNATMQALVHTPTGLCLDASSPSQSQSAVSTRTQTQTSSETQSPSQTQTISATRSQSRTPTQTRTVTCTATPSVVPQTCSNIDKSLVGSFLVRQGPSWGTNPPVYSCVDACALLFGGLSTSFGCSTTNASLTNQAWVSGYGSSIHCYGGTAVADTYSLSSNGGGYNMAPSFSAYVLDLCQQASVNYCWRCSSFLTSQTPTGSRTGSSTASGTPTPSASGTPGICTLPADFDCAAGPYTVRINQSSLGALFAVNTPFAWTATGKYTGAFTLSMNFSNGGGAALTASISPGCSAIAFSNGVIWVLISTPSASTSQTPSQAQTPTFTPTAAPVGCSPCTTWVYQGCYNDDPSRIIPLLIAAGGGIDVASCEALASSSCYDTVGLQAGGQCFAGAQVNYAALGSALNPCATLGGAWTNQVYTCATRSLTGSATRSVTPSQTITPAPTGCTPCTSWVYQGCWNDSPSRLIPIDIAIVSDVASCEALASSNCYDTVGLQFGGHCFVGAHVNYSALGSATGCAALGGLWTNQVYTCATRSQSPSSTSTSSATGTSTMSQVATSSQSQTASQVSIASVTRTASLSRTPSLTQTASPTQTPTQMQTLSSTQTPSSSDPSAPSLSQTLSQLQTASQTATGVLGSTSATTSLTQTPSPPSSSTQTVSSTQTQSLLLLSNSASATPTLSATSSLSSSQERSPSGSPTQSQSMSRSSRPTSSARSTSSQSLSGTPSPVQTPSATTSASSSRTPSMTQTPTPSQTVSQTPSPEPFSMLVSRSADDAPVFGGSINVSDSTAAVSIQLWLNRCPSTSDLADAVIQCAVSAVTPGKIFTAVGPSASSVGSTIPVTLAAPCDTAVFTPAKLSQAAWVGAFFSEIAGAGTSGTLRCGVSDQVTGQVLASTLLAVTTSPTAWPLWDDAISISAAGAMRSARLGIVVNATSALLAAAVSVGRGGSVTLAGALAIPLAVLLAAQTMWANATLPPVSPNSPAFTLTLVGASRVVLRSAGGSSVFSSGTMNATLGSARCSVSAVSIDGGWAVLDTPSSRALCGSDAVQCGYARLVLTTALTAGVRGASLACPPFCPGAVGGDIVPVVASDGSVVLGADPPSPVGALPTALPRAAVTSAGIFYAVKCADTGLWTDPASGACANASDPASLSCAFGGGDACSLCPSSALCPGGYRLWPRAGYWLPSEGSPVVLPCARPAPASRCQGWNARSASTQCGPAYLQSSYLCGACAPGFFADEAGSCNQCPVVASAWEVGIGGVECELYNQNWRRYLPLQQYSNLVYLLVAICGIVLAVYAALAILTCFVGGTITGGLFRLSNLALWALMCAQVVSDAAMVVSPSLPPLIARLYNVVGVLQLQGVLLPPACTGAPPFETEYSTMGAALGLWLAAVASYYALHNSYGRLGGQFVLMWAMVLYPSTTLTAARLLVCDSVSLTALGASLLDGGPALDATAAPDELIRLSVSSSNPYFVCWSSSGHHAGVGTLAAIVVPLYVLGLPIMTLWWLWRDPWVAAEVRRTKTASVGGTYIPRSYAISDTSGSEGNVSSLELASPTVELGDCGSASSALPDPLLGVFFYDYKPTAWYTKHIDLGILLLLSLLRALLPHPGGISGIAAKTAVICVALLAACAHVLWFRPYLDSDAWMGWVRALLLIDSFVITVLNALVAALDVGISGYVFDASIALCSYVIVALCGTTLTVLFAGFIWHAYKGAGEEEDARASPRQVATERVDETSAAASFPTLERPSSVGTAYDASVFARSPRSLGPLPLAAPSEAGQTARTGLSMRLGLTLFGSKRHSIRRIGTRVAPTAEQCAAIDALASAASQTPAAVCAACTAVQAQLSPPSSTPLLPGGRAGVAAGLLAGGALTTLASLLSGPFAAHADVVEAVSAAVADLAAASQEGDGTVPAPKLESSALASLSHGLADAIHNHGRDSQATLITACNALSSVCATSEAAADTVSRSFTAAGGVAHLAGALNHCRGVTRPTEVAAVCGALEDVAGSGVARIAAVKAGVPRAVSALVTALAVQPPGAALGRALAGVCGVVARVAIDEGGAEQFFTADGVAPLIVAASAYLERRGGGSELGGEAAGAALVLSVVQAACNALYVLKSFSWGRTTLVTAGAVQLLRKALAAYAGNAAIEDSAHWALQALLGTERRLSLSTIVPVL